MDQDERYRREALEKLKKVKTFNRNFIFCAGILIILFYAFEFFSPIEVSSESADILLIVFYMIVFPVILYRYRLNICPKCKKSLRPLNKLHIEVSSCQSCGLEFSQPFIKNQS